MATLHALREDNLILNILRLRAFDHKKGILVFGISSETHRVTSPQRLFNVIELKLNGRRIMQPLHFWTFPIRLEWLTPFAKNARIGGLVALDPSPSSQIHLSLPVNEQLFDFNSLSTKISRYWPLF